VEGLYLSKDNEFRKSVWQGLATFTREKDDATVITDTVTCVIDDFRVGVSDGDSDVRAFLF